MKLYSISASSYSDTEVFNDSYRHSDDVFDDELDDVTNDVLLRLRSSYDDVTRHGSPVFIAAFLSFERLKHERRCIPSCTRHCLETRQYSPHCIVACCLEGNFDDTSRNRELLEEKRTLQEEQLLNQRNIRTTPQEARSERAHKLFSLKTLQKRSHNLQKRRWGNTVLPCITSRCGGLAGDRRISCIIEKCNRNNL